MPKLLIVISIQILSSVFLSGKQNNGGKNAANGNDIRRGGGINHSGWFTNFLFTVAAIVSGAWSRRAENNYRKWWEFTLIFVLTCCSIHWVSFCCLYLTNTPIFLSVRSLNLDSIGQWVGKLPASEANTRSHFGRNSFISSTELHVWLRIHC